MAYEKLKIQTHTNVIVPGKTTPLLLFEKELKLYFSAKLTTFTTPIHLHGTDFQKKAWYELSKIPYGQTISYAEQASALGNNKAYRAVARANNTNQLAIIIPCHRVINNNGKLGGYTGGLHRKQWLIQHESYSKST